MQTRGIPPVVDMDDYEPEIEWEAINAAANWRLVDRIDDVFLYESLGFDGELALIFADRRAAREQDWDRIYQAVFSECGREWVWHWPNG